MRKVKIILASLAIVVSSVFAVMPAWAIKCENASGDSVEPVSGKCPTGSVEVGNVQTNILPSVGVGGLLKIILNVLVYGLGAAAVLGVIIVGIQYMTSRDNEQQATAAKKRLFEIVIGLVAWAVMWAVLKWLIPGFSL